MDRLEAKEVHEQVDQASQAPAPSSNYRIARSNLSFPSALTFGIETRFESASGWRPCSATQGGEVIKMGQRTLDAAVHDGLAKLMKGVQVTHLLLDEEAEMMTFLAVNSDVQAGFGSILPLNVI